MLSKETKYVIECDNDVRSRQIFYLQHLSFISYFIAILARAIATKVQYDTELTPRSLKYWNMKHVF